MTYSLQNKSTWVAIGLVLVAIASYAAFRIYPLFNGPVVEIESPREDTLITGQTFEVKGKVIRAVEVKLQGRVITINTEGEFTETLVAHEPYTILVLEATDKYKKTAKKILKVSVKLKDINSEASSSPSEVSTKI